MLLQIVTTQWLSNLNEVLITDLESFSPRHVLGALVTCWLHFEETELINVFANHAKPFVSG